MADPALHDLSNERLVPRSLGLALVVCAIPPLIAASLYVWYRTAPSHYLTHVLEAAARESQLVEKVTYMAAGIASMVLAVTAIRMWSMRRRAEVKGGAIIVLVVAAAAFFFTMEEISWGHHIFRGAGEPGEINLHNTLDKGISVQSMGGIFLVVVFIGLPLVWCFRARLGLPADLAPAVPAWPTVVCMIGTFLWGDFNDLYRALYADYEERRFYVEFVEQVNEHKEMLVGVTLLVYACSRAAWRRRAAAMLPAPSAV